MSVALVNVPYNDYNQLVKDSEDKASIIQLLKTDFPDDTCMVLAIKSILKIETTTTSSSN